MYDSRLTPPRAVRGALFAVSIHLIAQPPHGHARLLELMAVRGQGLAPRKREIQWLLHAGPTIR